MQLKQKPAPLPQIPPEALPPAGLESSLVPTAPESPAACKHSKEPARVSLVHEQGLKHTSRPNLSIPNLLPFFSPNYSSARDGIWGAGDSSRPTR